MNDDVRIENLEFRNQDSKPDSFMDSSPDSGIRLQEEVISPNRFDYPMADIGPSVKPLNRIDPVEMPNTKTRSKIIATPDKFM